MSRERVLIRLGARTSEAAGEVLAELAGAGAVARASVEVAVDAAEATAGLGLPCVATDIAFADGVTGGCVLLLPITAARALAAAMAGREPDGGDGPLSEEELASVSEATNQAASAAATATGQVVDQKVEFTRPRVQVVADAAGLRTILGASSCLVTASFTLLGTGCRLVHPLPETVVARLAADEPATGETASAAFDPELEPLRETLHDISVRVWAELGRSEMPMAQVVSLPPGDVVELDRAAEAPIDVYVDGMAFATGRLVVDEEGGLAVSIEWVAGADRIAAHAREDGRDDG